MSKRVQILAILVMMVVLLFNIRPAQAGSDAWIALTAPDGNIYIVHPDGSGRTPITQDGRMHPNAENEPEGRVEYINLRWSPDGGWLALVRQFSKVENTVLVTQNTLYLYDSRANKLHLLGKEITDFDWSPDSQSLVYSLPGEHMTFTQPVKPAKGIWQYLLSSGQSAELVKPADVYSLTAPRFSPDGRYLTFYEVVNYEGLGNFGVYDMQAHEQRVWKVQDQPVGAHSWTPDGSLMVFDRNTYVPQPGERIWKGDMEFKYVVPLSPDDPKTAFYGPQVSPDGKQVVFFASPENVPYASIWAMNIDGSHARQLYSPNENVYFMNWSPDSQRIVFVVGPYMQERIMLLDPSTSTVTPLASGDWFSWQPGSTSTSSDDPILQDAAPQNGEGITAAHPTEISLSEQAHAFTPVPVKSSPLNTAPAQPAAPRFSNLLIILMFGLAALIVLVVVIVLLVRKR